MGFIRFVFYIVVGYAVLGVLRMIFSPKKPRPNNRKEKPRDTPDAASSRRMNTDGIGDYIDYEEVK